MHDADHAEGQSGKHDVDVIDGEGKPDRELLSYEYLQMLPQLAEGDANKVFVVPSEFAAAFGGIGEALAGRRRPPDAPAVPPPAPDGGAKS